MRPSPSGARHDTAEAIAPPVANATDDKACTDGGHAGQSGQAIAMDDVETFQIGGGDAQQVIRLTCHKVTFEDFGEIGNRSFEAIHAFAALTGQGHFDESMKTKTERCWIKPGGVTRDDAGLLQRADATVTCRRGKADDVANLVHGTTTIFLKRFQYCDVEAIHARFFHSGNV